MMSSTVCQRRLVNTADRRHKKQVDVLPNVFTLFIRTNKEIFLHTTKESYSKNYIGKRIISFQYRSTYCVLLYNLYM